MNTRDLLKNKPEDIINQVIHELKGKCSNAGGLTRGSENWKIVNGVIESEFDEAIKTEESEDVKTAGSLRRKKKKVLEHLDDYWTHYTHDIKAMWHREET
ncbi:MAG: hypothetical protein ACLPY5_03325 [Candidatus Bathyarchaeia archaeon]